MEQGSLDLRMEEERMSEEREGEEVGGAGRRGGGAGRPHHLASCHLLSLVSTMACR